MSVQRQTMLTAKIKARLDQLQTIMESNDHLKDPDGTYLLTTEISKFWSILSDEDREYVQYTQQAIKEKTTWNVKK